MTTGILVGQQRNLCYLQTHELSWRSKKSTKVNVTEPRDPCTVEKMNYITNNTMYRDASFMYLMLVLNDTDATTATYTYTKYSLVDSTNR